MKNLTFTGLESLSISEKKNTSGGFLPIILAGCTIYGGAVALSVGAGYLYGKLFD